MIIKKEILGIRKWMRNTMIGRAYKIPKVCVIEYLMGEDMCRIN